MTNIKKECGSCAHAHVCSFSSLYQYYLEFIDLNVLECKYYKEEKVMDGQPVREVKEGEVSRSMQLISDTWPEMKDAIDSWIATFIIRSGKIWRPNLLEKPKNGEE